jgi:hypothetical protein
VVAKLLSYDILAASEAIKICF